MEFPVLEWLYILPLTYSEIRKKKFFVSFFRFLCYLILKTYFPSFVGPLQTIYPLYSSTSFSCPCFSLSYHISLTLLLFTPMEASEGIQITHKCLKGGKSSVFGLVNYKQICIWYPSFYVFCSTLSHILLIFIHACVLFCRPVFVILSCFYTFGFHGINLWCLCKLFTVFN